MSGYVESPSGELLTWGYTVDEDEPESLELVLVDESGALVDVVGGISEPFTVSDHGNVHAAPAAEAFLARLAQDMADELNPPHPLRLGEPGQSCRGELHPNRGHFTGEPSLRCHLCGFVVISFDEDDEPDDDDSGDAGCIERELLIRAGRERITDDDVREIAENYGAPWSPRWLELRDRVVSLAAEPDTARHTSRLLSYSLCPMHQVDYAICFDDQNPACASIRAAYPEHDT